MDTKINILEDGNFKLRQELEKSEAGSDQQRVSRVSSKAYGTVISLIREAHLWYIRYRAEKDPARGMFTRLYSPQWTEEYIHGFLFDLK